MSQPDSHREPAESKFRSTLIRVLIVQIVALALLALLQLRYHI